jgi:hypothetical protein
VLSSLKIFPIQLEDNNLIALAKMPSTPLSENLPKIKLWEFFYSEWRGSYRQLGISDNACLSERGIVAGYLVTQHITENSSAVFSRLSDVCDNAGHGIGTQSPLCGALEHRSTKRRGTRLKFVSAVDDMVIEARPGGRH